MKTKIEVFESPMSSKVIAKFKSIDRLLLWNSKHDISADCIAVNGYNLLGWDELYDFND